MKSLILAFISFFSLVLTATSAASAFASSDATALPTAAGKMDMTCITEFPTTSFAIREVGDIVIVEVFHHNGPRYMPVFDGLATPSDIAKINAKAQTLTALPTIQRFEWPRSKCQIQGTMIESCFGTTDEQDQNGFKVKGWSFYSSLVTEKSFAGTYNSYRLALDLTIDGQSYSMPMKYAENECSPESLMARELRTKSQLSK
ncbi:hypothetical protein [Bdellovibrio sp. BCCA]|uniref:hypothetical protein n=1 Tax=Bdellovibrio sp. BCCA TaxID=3136281 RepID=UPI0030F0C888